MASVDPALLDEAVDLLRQAGELTLRWFRDDALDVERKGDGTPVTAADKAAERFLREEIARRRPDDTIIGEEEATRVFHDNPCLFFGQNPKWRRKPILLQQTA